MVKLGDSSKKFSKGDMQEILIENFVGLQKAMTNMSIKFEGLSENIRRLLEVFETSAKNFSTAQSDSPDKKDFVEKINSLLDQNKTIARGLVMLEEKLKTPQQQQTSQMQRPVEEAGEYTRAKPLPRL